MTRLLVATVRRRRARRSRRRAPRGGVAPKDVLAQEGLFDPASAPTCGTSTPSSHTTALGSRILAAGRRRSRCAVSRRGPAPLTEACAGCPGSAGTPASAPGPRRQRRQARAAAEATGDAGAGRPHPEQPVPAAHAGRTQPEASRSASGPRARPHVPETPRCLARADQLGLPCFPQGRRGEPRWTKPSRGARRRGQRGRLPDPTWAVGAPRPVPAGRGRRAGRRRGHRRGGRATSGSRLPARRRAGWSWAGHRGGERYAPGAGARKQPPSWCVALAVLGRVRGRGPARRPVGVLRRAGRSPGPRRATAHRAGGGGACEVAG